MPLCLNSYRLVIYGTIWAASRQNQQNDCAPSQDSDQSGHPPSLISLRCAFNGYLRTQAFIMRTAKTLISLGGCPGWSESLLGTHAILLVLSWGGSYYIKLVNHQITEKMHEQISGRLQMCKHTDWGRLNWKIFESDPVKLITQANKKTLQTKSNISGAIERLRMFIWKITSPTSLRFIFSYHSLFHLSKFTLISWWTLTSVIINTIYTLAAMVTGVRGAIINIYFTQISWNIEISNIHYLKLIIIHSGIV